MSDPDAFAKLGDDIRRNRSALIKRELAIDALRDKADDYDEPVASQVLDEVAALTAELDQDWANWMKCRDAYESVKHRAVPNTVEAPAEQLAKLDDRYSVVLEEIARLQETDDDELRRDLTAFAIDVEQEREYVRSLRDAQAATPAPAAPGDALRAAPRVAPRARARRTRSITRASSRGGDSGDDSSGEPDLPGVARLARALCRALIARWRARVIDRSGGG